MKDKQSLTKLFQEISIFYWEILIWLVDLQVLGSALIRKQLMTPGEVGGVTMVTQSDLFKV